MAPRTDAKSFGIRPGDMPKREDRRPWQALPDHAWHERKVVVLNKNDRVLCIDFLTDRVGESLVHSFILLPVFGSKDRASMRQVTERPEAFVREAVVVAVFLGFRQPHTSNHIRFFSGRDSNAALGI